MRIEATLWISYDADIDQARTVLVDMMKTIPGVVTTPAPSVAVVELADSSVNLALRAYGNAQDQASIQSEILEQAKKTLDASSIEIPFPQRVVTMIK